MIKFFKQKNKQNKAFTRTLKRKHLVYGFTLVETLVAISIFTISILAIMSVLGKGMSDTNYAKKQMTATYLAQEGIEYIRNMRDTFVLSNTNSANGWNDFLNKISSCSLGIVCGFNSTVSYIDPGSIFLCTDMSLCKLYLENGNYSINSTGTDSGFIRTISLVAISNDEIKINSTVSWQQGSGNYNVSFSENLYNWIE